MQQNTVEDVDADFMFFKSLVPILKKLPGKKKLSSKIKIQNWSSEYSAKPGSSYIKCVFNDAHLHQLK